LCAEASTGYTKRPDFEGVAERAKAVCTPGLKVIYLVRDPIKRIVSHHYHEYARGNMPESIDEAVRSFPALVNYSMYAMQVEPWIEALGADRVRIVRFEEYVSDRAGWSSRLCSFLGIDPRPDLIETDKVFNKSEGKPVMRGPWRLVAHHPFYRRLIRPLMPVGLKDRVRGKVLPKAPVRPDPPSEQTQAWIRDRVREDQARLEDLLGSGVNLPA